MSTLSAEKRFRTEYGALRADEGRSLDAAALFTLPYLRSGPIARQWSVRARSYDTFMNAVLTPLAGRTAARLRVADLGAGNGWLSWRIAQRGHSAIALDIRDDVVDGLGAAGPYVEDAKDRLHRCVASFEHLPLSDACCDLLVFNASLHYAMDLPAALREARRTLRVGGRLAIVDSPFYQRESDGEAMVEEKRRTAGERFGSHAAALTALTFVEYLTRARLEAASPPVRWTRHRVRYPLWYELRPVMARLRANRRPSRFDVWEGTPT